MAGLRGWRVGVLSGSVKAQLYATTTSLVLVAALTAGLAALQRVVAVETVTIIYLIPVLVGAIRGGVVPALVAAVAAVGASAFFFYEPIYDFRVHNPIHLIDLALFIIVAVVTGRLATNVRQAKMRAEAESLREALIGSVSHELRTPLASILGAASVLAQSRAIADEAKLSGLVGVVREEAERLDADIGNLLEATRISSEGLRPHPEWVDPGDIVNAAIERKRRLLAGHPLKVVVTTDLPLVHIDSVLVEKALGQLVENAAKYSAAGSPIDLVASLAGDMVRIDVRDQGIGLTMEEREKIWERFYRSARHAGRVPGSGLGLWIARALVTACEGRVEASSAGVGRGATLSIYLPVRLHAGSPPEEADE